MSKIDFFTLLGATQYMHVTKQQGGNSADDVAARCTEVGSANRIAADTCRRCAPGSLQNRKLAHRRDISHFCFHLNPFVPLGIESGSRAPGCRAGIIAGRRFAS